MGDRSGRKPRTVVVQTAAGRAPGPLPRVGQRQPPAGPRRDRTAGSATCTSPTWVPTATPSSTARYLAEVAHDALIIDVRFNGGGHVSSLLLEKLARRRIAYAVARWAPPEPYPEESPAGPLVAITNEQAGSDGDIFTHSFKLLGLGPVVGKRTWGGVIGINPTYPLVDGSVTTQPEYSFWFEDVGWGVENYGTDPGLRRRHPAPGPRRRAGIRRWTRPSTSSMRALKRHRPVGPDVGTPPRPRPAAAPAARAAPSGNGKVGTTQKIKPRKR